ncbi:barstar family protein [Streptomyces sp. SH5]|uniref:barstar family protein n=1 Tax=Streptomyces sp. SH5 TaxID=3041765 RepID=UPI002477F4EE|nr:barstar family protein [Streptomyces sp. SH5]WGP13899.1 barstar family protein [Streptomyces sp. SH5]
MVTIGVASVASEDELHRLLQREFGFPDFYGRNWAAFWDAVSSLVLIPEHVRIVGWKPLVERVSDGAMMLADCLDRYRDLYRPGLRVEYL